MVLCGPMRGLLLAFGIAADVVMNYGDGEMCLSTCVFQFFSTELAFHLPDLTLNGFPCRSAQPVLLGLGFRFCALCREQRPAERSLYRRGEWIPGKLRRAGRDEVTPLTREQTGDGLHCVAVGVEHAREREESYK